MGDGSYVDPEYTMVYDPYRLSTVSGGVNPGELGESKHNTGLWSSDCDLIINIIVIIMNIK